MYRCLSYNLSILLSIIEMVGVDVGKDGFIKIGDVLRGTFC